MYKRRKKHMGEFISPKSSELAEYIGVLSRSSIKPPEMQLAYIGDYVQDRYGTQDPEIYHQLLHTAARRSADTLVSQLITRIGEKAY